MESKLPLDWVKGVSQLHRSSSALTFDKYIPMPYMFTSMLMGGLCFFAVTVLETTTSPWVLDGKKYYAPFYYDPRYFFLAMKLWPAPMCGILVGLCQFTCVCVLQCQVHFMNCVSHVLAEVGRKFLLLPKERQTRDVENSSSWQAYLMGGMLLGTRLSMFVSTKVFVMTTSWVWSGSHFCGGMALYFGARYVRVYPMSIISRHFISLHPMLDLPVVIMYFMPVLDYPLWC